MKLVGYSEYDFATDLDRKKSIIRFVFTFGGTVICWKSSCQKVVVLSATKAEYNVLSEAIKEATWLKRLVGEFGYS